MELYATPGRMGCEPYSGGGSRVMVTAYLACESWRCMLLSSAGLLFSVVSYVVVGPESEPSVLNYRKVALRFGSL